MEEHHRPRPAGEVRDDGDRHGLVEPPDRSSSPARYAQRPPAVDSPSAPLKWASVQRMPPYRAWRTTYSLWTLTFLPSGQLRTGQKAFFIPVFFSGDLGRQVRRRGTTRTHVLGRVPPSVAAAYIQTKSTIDKSFPPRFPEPFKANISRRDSRCGGRG